MKIADQIGATSNQHTTNPTLLTTQPNQFTTIPKVTTQFNQFTTIPKVTTQSNQFTTIPKVTTEPNQVPNVNLDQSIINNHQMVEHINNPDPTQQWILDYNGKYKLSKSVILHNIFSLVYDQVAVKDSCYEVVMSPLATDEDVSYVDAADYCSSANGSLISPGKVDEVQC